MEVKKVNFGYRVFISRLNFKVTDFRNHCLYIMSIQSILNLLNGLDSNEQKKTERVCKLSNIETNVYESMLHTSMLGGVHISLRYFLLTKCYSWFLLRKN